MKASVDPIQRFWIGDPHGGGKIRDGDAFTETLESVESGAAALVASGGMGVFRAEKASEVASSDWIRQKWRKW